ncbi:MAG: hypothetical protein RR603_05005 [Kurthia sp.]|uniref:YokE-like PH domain-containing protein n=1 Tax=Kurthia zopfii TaxID=1650 RepID=A0A8B4QCR9_9BACL|nr:hypothetical protein [Kurthia zopfii]PWI23645.1 hypothetical protein DF281_02070 [Kurthia zopfii]TDR42674.1 hypothetical protein DFR61_10349 [Kurthia zopfii]GEK30147.1 hypothetical protein KZO01_04560 [Kurthia zopfii]STX10489.1 Uncharacterised protein [Kurthia zopfii]
MGSMQDAERAILLEFPQEELLQQTLYDLHMNDHTTNVFKSETMFALTNLHLYICTIEDEKTVIESFPFNEIQAVFRRTRILSGEEIIFFTDQGRQSLSHIEEGCPISFMHAVQQKLGRSFSSPA